ncbi:MAG: hypothetical protein OQL19_08740 [Gammaproteobacteria bacterium]|nr:hypothetical protein [Gammaproteobacteria bacterium]
MLRKFIYLSIITFLATIQPAFSEAGWTSSSLIKEIVATTDGKFIIHATPKSSPSDCKDKEKFYLHYNLHGADKIYKLLLDAAVSQLHVKLYITGRCELFGMSELSKASIIFE